MIPNKAVCLFDPLQIRSDFSVFALRNLVTTGKVNLVTMACREEVER